MLAKGRGVLCMQQNTMVQTLLVFGTLFYFCLHSLVKIFYSKAVFFKFLPFMWLSDALQRPSKVLHTSGIKSMENELHFMQIGIMKYLNRV